MKILILQLARFGDIYSTWPALQALKRQNPENEIHLVVRSRFRGATQGLDCVDHIHELNTAHVLEPIVNAAEEYPSSLERLLGFVQNLKAQKFDRIVNLSFSPFSSYLVSLLKTDSNQIIGYQRYSDGHLEISDFWSSYFYAQVGIGKSNRHHLVDIFAQMLGVELRALDWSVAPLDSKRILKPSNSFLVVHLGASQKEKTYSIHQWISVLLTLVEKWSGSIVLIGAQNEKHLATKLEEIFSDRIYNLIGRTEITDLFSILKSAELLIGADSAPIHIASLVGCVTLNLSCDTVNLWETGPRAPASRILLAPSLSDLPPEKVASEALSILVGDLPRDADFYVDSNRSIIALQNKKIPLSARLIDFLYFDGEAPRVSDLNYATALVHMFDLAQLAIEQLYNLQRNSQDRGAQAVLQRTDELIAELAVHVPEVGVLVRWFQSEKIQIPPSGFQVILEKTFISYKKLTTVLTELQSHVDLTPYQGRNSGASELEGR